MQHWWNQGWNPGNVISASIMSSQLDSSYLVEISKAESLLPDNGQIHEKKSVPPTHTAGLFITNSLHLSFIEPIFSWNIPLVSLTFLKRYLVFPILLFSSISLHWSLSYLSLLFFGTLHSNEYIFPFLLCLSLLFFSQLFVKPPQTAILLFCISLSWGWSWSLSPVQCHEPPSIVHQSLYQI